MSPAPIFLHQSELQMTHSADGILRTAKNRNDFLIFYEFGEEQMGKIVTTSIETNRRRGSLGAGHGRRGGNRCIILPS